MPADGSVHRADNRTESWSPRAERARYMRMLPELQAEYAGRYIVLREGRVIGVGDTADEAAEAALDRLGFVTALFVHRVGEPLAPDRQTDSPLDVPRQARGPS